MQHILVWTAQPSRELCEQGLPLLDDGERTAADRFVFARDRDHHVAAHALKRLALSAVAPVPPEAWRFESGIGGKPRIRSGPALEFNISHCDGLVACAVSRTLALGIDVEPASREAPRELVASCFTVLERRWLAALPGAEQDRGFFRLWTLKEAFIKATGCGLSQPLTDFSVAFDPLRLIFHDAALGESRSWSARQEIVAGSHLLALIWHASSDIAVQIQSRHWPP